jgi:PilZ domain
MPSTGTSIGEAALWLIMDKMDKKDYAGAPAMEDSDRDRSFRDEQRPERRVHPRVRVKVPVELFAPNSDIPQRGATSDISEAGCYIETMFPFPVGTKLEMSLQLEGTLLAVGTVVTCDPQVGNGIEFARMLPEDLEELRAFVSAAQEAE